MNDPIRHGVFCHQIKFIFPVVLLSNQFKLTQRQKHDFIVARFDAWLELLYSIFALQFVCVCALYFSQSYCFIFNLWLRGWFLAAYDQDIEIDWDGIETPGFPFSQTDGNSVLIILTSDQGL